MKPQDTQEAIFSSRANLKKIFLNAFWNLEGSPPTHPSPYLIEKALTFHQILVSPCCVGVSPQVFVILGHALPSSMENLPRYDLEPFYVYRDRLIEEGLSFKDRRKILPMLIDRINKQQEPVSPLFLFTQCPIIVSSVPKQHIIQIEDSFGAGMMEKAKRGKSRFIVKNPSIETHNASLDKIVKHIFGLDLPTPPRHKKAKA